MSKWIGGRRYMKRCDGIIGMKDDTPIQCKKTADDQYWTEEGLKEVCIDCLIKWQKESGFFKRKTKEELVEEVHTLRDSMVNLLQNMDWSIHSNVFRGQKVVIDSTFAQSIDESKVALGLDRETCLGDK